MPSTLIKYNQIKNEQINNAKNNAKKTILTKFISKPIIGPALATPDEYNYALFNAVRDMIQKFTQYCKGYILAANIKDTSVLVNIVNDYFSYSTKKVDIFDFYLQNMDNQINEYYIKNGIDSAKKSFYINSKKKKQYTYKVCIKYFTLNVLYQISLLKIHMEKALEEYQNIFLINFDINDIFWSIYDVVL